MYGFSREKGKCADFFVVIVDVDADISSSALPVVCIAISLIYIIDSQVCSPFRVCVFVVLLSPMDFFFLVRSTWVWIFIQTHVRNFTIFDKSLCKRFNALVNMPSAQAASPCSAHHYTAQPFAIDVCTRARTRTRLPFANFTQNLMRLMWSCAANVFFLFLFLVLFIQA